MPKSPQEIPGELQAPIKAALFRAVQSGQLSPEQHSTVQGFFSKYGTPEEQAHVELMRQGLGNAASLPKPHVVGQLGVTEDENAKEYLVPDARAGFWTVMTGSAPLVNNTDPQVAAARQQFAQQQSAQATENLKENYLFGEHPVQNAADTAFGWLPVGSAGRGVKEMLTPNQRMTGALRTTDAALSTFDPTIGSGLVSAPVHTLTGLAAGTLTGEAAGAGARQLGANDEQAGFVERISGLAGGILGAHFGGKVLDSKPIGPKVEAPQTKPVAPEAGQATPETQGASPVNPPSQPLPLKRSRTKSDLMELLGLPDESKPAQPQGGSSGKYVSGLWFRQSSGPESAPSAKGVIQPSTSETPQAQATPKPFTKEAAARDTQLFQQAQKELGSNANISDVISRANELKAQPVKQATPLPTVPTPKESPLEAVSRLQSAQGTKPDFNTAKSAMDTAQQNLDAVTKERDRAVALQKRGVVKTDAAQGSTYRGARTPLQIEQLNKDVARKQAALNSAQTDYIRSLDPDTARSEVARLREEAKTHQLAGRQINNLLKGDTLATRIRGEIMQSKDLDYNQKLKARQVLLGDNPQGTPSVVPLVGTGNKGLTEHAHTYMKQELSKFMDLEKATELFKQTRKTTTPQEFKQAQANFQKAVESFPSGHEVAAKWMDILVGKKPAMIQYKRGRAQVGVDQETGGIKLPAIPSATIDAVTKLTGSKPENLSIAKTRLKKQLGYHFERYGQLTQLAKDIAQVHGTDGTDAIRTVKELNKPTVDQTTGTSKWFTVKDLSDDQLLKVAQNSKLAARVLGPGSDVMSQVNSELQLRAAKAKAEPLVAQEKLSQLVKQNLSPEPVEPRPAGVGKQLLGKQYLHENFRDKMPKFEANLAAATTIKSIEPRFKELQKQLLQSGVPEGADESNHPGLAKLNAMQRRIDEIRAEKKSKVKSAEEAAIAGATGKGSEEAKVGLLGQRVDATLPNGSKITGDVIDHTNGIVKIGLGGKDPESGRYQRVFQVPEEKVQTRQGLPQGDVDSTLKSIENATASKALEQSLKAPAPETEGLKSERTSNDDVVAQGNVKLTPEILAKRILAAAKDKHTEAQNALDTLLVEKKITYKFHEKASDYLAGLQKGEPALSPELKEALGLPDIRLPKDKVVEQKIKEISAATKNDTDIKELKRIYDMPVPNLKGEVKSRIEQLMDKGFKELVPVISDWASGFAPKGSKESLGFAKEVLQAAIDHPEAPMHEAYKKAKELGYEPGKKPPKTGGGNAATSGFSAEDKARIEERKAQGEQDAKNSGYDPEAIAREVMSHGLNFMSIEQLPKDVMQEAGYKGEFLAHYHDPQTGSTGAWPVDELDTLGSHIRGKRGMFNPPAKPQAMAAAAGAEKPQSLGKGMDALSGFKPKQDQPPAQDTSQPEKRQPLTGDALKAAGDAIQLHEELSRSGFKTAADMILQRVKDLDPNDTSRSRKAFILKKALEVYKAAQASSDPMALGKAMEVIKKGSEGQTFRASMGFDLLTNLLTGKKPQENPTIPRLDSLASARVKGKQGFFSSVVDTLARVPSDLYKSFVEKFYHLESIGKDAARAGLISEEENPFYHATLSKNMVQGWLAAQNLEYNKVFSDAYKNGLFEVTHKLIELRGYKAALDDLHAKLADATGRAHNAETSLNNLLAQVKVGMAPLKKVASAINQLRLEAKSARAEMTRIGDALVNKTALPAGYGYNEVAQDMHLLAQQVDPAKLAQANKYADQAFHIHSKVWDMLHDSGIVSDTMYQRFQQLGPDHLPLHRIMDKFEKEAQVGAGSKLYTTGTPLYKRFGSERATKDPIENLISADQRSIINGLRNHTARQIVKTLSDLSLAKEVKTSGPSTIPVWENGEKKLYQVPPAIAHEMKFINGRDWGFLENIMRGAMKPFKAGATYMNLYFSLPNAFRHAMDYGLLDNSSPKNPVEMAKFTAQLFGNLKEMLNNDPIYLEHLKSGAAFGTYQESIHPDAFVQNVRNDYSMGQRLKNSPREITRGIENVISAPDRSLKYQAWKRNLQQGMGPAEAAFKARKLGGAPDFSSGGILTPELNILQMFSGAHIKYLERALKAVNPTTPEGRRKLAVLGTGFVALEGALYSWNNQFQAEDGSKEIDHVPSEIQNQSWYILLPSTYRTSDGAVRHDAIQIPKPLTARIFSNPIRSIIDMAVSGKPSMEQAGLDIASQYMPGQYRLKAGEVGKDLGLGLVSSSNPLIKEPLEQAMNYDTWTRTPIVPRHEQDMPAEMQTSPYMSKTLEDVGEATGTSPSRLRHAVKSAGAGVAELALNLTDLARGQSKTSPMGLEGQEQYTKSEVLGPLARRFMSTQIDDVERQRMEDFYNTAQKSREVATGVDNYLKEPGTQQKALDFLQRDNNTQLYSINKSMGDLTKEMAQIRMAQKRITEDATMPDEEKRDIIRNLYYAKLAILEGYEKSIKPQLEAKH